MKLLIVAWCACLCLSYTVITCTASEPANFGSEDTVVIEAEVGDTPAPLPVDRKAREENEGSCMTKSGEPGNCESVHDCFPRLFPVHPTDNDTPQASGTYNQNLVRFLIDASGFCGRSSESYDLAELRALQICCASVKAPDFPVEPPPNAVISPNTETVDDELTKKSCGEIKVDRSKLPVIPKPGPANIVGGRDAVLGEFPWMVAMLRRGQQFCGASLLDNRNILTAAHCVEFMTKQDVSALRLYIGDLDIYSNKDTNHTERKAKRVLYHKGFTMKNLAHDIALIHLDRPVAFSETVQPVCLHTGDPPYDSGKTGADVCGWGTTSSGGNQSPKLLTVNLRVMTNSECNEKYEKARKMVGAGMVCAGSPGKDSCQGDSGGPLVVDSRGKAKQIGIVSWGIGCASYPGVYTRVDKYAKWIAKNKQ